MDNFSIGKIMTSCCETEDASVREYDRGRTIRVFSVTL